jgi:hypothetical protein
MTLSRGCRSDKAKFAHNRRLDFAFARHCSLQTRRVMLSCRDSGRAIIRLRLFQFGRDTAIDLLFIPAQREEQEFLISWKIFNLKYGNRKISIQEIIPLMDVIPIPSNHDRNPLPKLSI